MALTSRISLTQPDSEPEDFLASSLGVIFPDDVTNDHGDAGGSLVYTSPHLRNQIRLTLWDPNHESDRFLFAHFLWNASLQLAELVESSTLSVTLSSPSPLGPPDPSSWDVGGKSTIELGAGTALPSLMSALVGARRVVITDYPRPPVLANLKANLEANLRPCPTGYSHPTTQLPCNAAVEGHSWGELDGGEDSGFALREKGVFDRVFACDCLWVPGQHDNLRRSISHFLTDGPDARAWVVAGFHTGRAKMRGFFDRDELAGVGLEVERMWERDCNGVEREWVWDRGLEDIRILKRWLVIAILRRRLGS